MADSSASFAIASPAADLDREEAPRSGARVSSNVDQLRLAGLVRAHYEFLWRSLRRLGVIEADVDDAAQRVLGVVARKLGEIEPRAEKSFVFQTALRVASEMRRAKARTRTVNDEDAVAGALDGAPTPEEVLDQKEARARLDAILDRMTMELRAVFVLFELEEMSTNEIAALLAIPPGTVSSRLSRARDEFKAMAARALREKQQKGGRT